MPASVVWLSACFCLSFSSWLSRPWFLPACTECCQVVKQSVGGLLKRICATLGSDVMHSAPAASILFSIQDSAAGMVAPVASTAYIIYFVLFFICFQSGMAHGFAGEDWDPE